MKERLKLFMLISIGAIIFLPFLMGVSESEIEEATAAGCCPILKTSGLDKVEYPYTGYVYDCDLPLIPVASIDVTFISGSQVLIDVGVPGYSGPTEFQVPYSSECRNGKRYISITEDISDSFNYWWGNMYYTTEFCVENIEGNGDCINGDDEVEEITGEVRWWVQTYNHTMGVWALQKYCLLENPSGFAATYP